MFRMKWLILIAITLHAYPFIVDSAGSSTNRSTSSPSSQESARSLKSLGVKIDYTKVIFKGKRGAIFEGKCWRLDFISCDELLFCFNWRQTLISKSKYNGPSCRRHMRILIENCRHRQHCLCRTINSPTYKGETVAAKLFNDEYEWQVHEEVYYLMQSLIPHGTEEEKKRELEANGIIYLILSARLLEDAETSYGYLNLMPLHGMDLKRFRDECTPDDRNNKNYYISLYYASFEMMKIMNYLKKLGIVHRDIKPKNFLIRRERHRHAHVKWIVLIDLELAREFDPSTKRVKQEYYAGTALFSSIETLSLYPQMIKHDFASLILTIGYMRDGLFLPNQMQYQSDEAFVTVQPDKAVGSSQTDEALALLQVKDDLKCFKGLPMSYYMVELYFKQLADCTALQDQKNPYRLSAEKTINNKTKVEQFPFLPTLLLQMMRDYEHMAFKRTPNYNKYIRQITTEIAKHPTLSEDNWAWLQC